MTLRIALYDDEDKQREIWIGQLERLGVGTLVPLDDFEKQVDRLENRRKEARTSNAVETLEGLGIDSAFDDLDILIVDYDLVHSTNLTGEEVAYLVRCYSKCGIIVALNQFGAGKSFDLTLSGHLESFADLNIESAFLDDWGLWTADKSKWQPFRPWSWPVLPLLLESFDWRVKHVADNLTKPILPFLSLGSQEAGVLPRETLEQIQGRTSGDVETTTFQDFVIHSPLGLKPKDANAPITELIPRIAAARLHRWLECLVLGGQEVLVDAPHLVTRYPSLLDGPIEERSSWELTAQIVSMQGIDKELVQPQAFRHRHWLSRPAWLWRKVRNNEGIAEVKDPWSVKNHDWVFCEDSSRFEKRDDAQGFIADLPTSFSRRYVKKADSNVEYHPGVRFSL